MDKVIAWLFVIAIILGVDGVLAWCFMGLWNAYLAPATGFKVIDLWQSVGITSLIWFTLLSTRTVR